MIDTVAMNLASSAGARSVAGVAGTSAPAGLTPPSGDSIVRFENSLNGVNPGINPGANPGLSPPDIGPDPEVPLLPGPAIAPPRVAGAPDHGIASLGNRVLQSMEKISSDFTSTLAGGAADLLGGPASTSFVHILDVQRAVIRVSIESDLAAKLITKSGQIVDQLARTS